MRIATAGNELVATSDALGAALDELGRKLGTEPDLLFVYARASHDFELIASTLRARRGARATCGASSCGGVMTDAGFWGGEAGLAVLGISDPEGSYGVGAANIADDGPAFAGARALVHALERAGRSGEAPSMIWLVGTPGHEEGVIRGIVDVVGSDVPIIGGSAADDDIVGDWWQLAEASAFRDAVVVVVMFPSTSVAFNFHSGYAPTDQHGTVTSADGRVVHSIDGRPAVEVYDEWTGGRLHQHLAAGGTILRETSLAPVGRVDGSWHGVSHYLLAHPAMVTPEGGLAFFAELHEGDVVWLMTGSVQSLIERAGRVAGATMETWSPSTAAPSGALVVYCAGCMLAVRHKLDEVVAGLKVALRGAPFLGAFTFGEQGCFARGENRHSNLMISVVALAEHDHGRTLS